MRKKREFNDDIPETLVKTQHDVTGVKVLPNVDKP